MAESNDSSRRVKAWPTPHAGKQANRQAGRQASRHATKQIGRQAGRQASMQAGRQPSNHLCSQIALSLSLAGSVLPLMASSSGTSDARNEEHWTYPTPAEYFGWHVTSVNVSRVKTASGWGWGFLVKRRWSLGTEPPFEFYTEREEIGPTRTHRPVEIEVSEGMTIAIKWLPKDWGNKKYYCNDVDLPIILPVPGIPRGAIGQMPSRVHAEERMVADDEVEECVVDLARGNRFTPY